MEYFLRDAGCLLPDTQNDYNARMDRAVALCRKLSIQIQITLSQEQFLDQDGRWIEPMAAQLQGFNNVLVHLHTRDNLPFGNNSYTATVFRQLRRFSDLCPSLKGICVHPDLISHYDIWRELSSPRYYIAIEVLDGNALFGHRKRHIETLLNNYAYFDLVLDTAHIMETQAMGEPSLSQYASLFRSRIREIQVSHNGNYYQRMPESFTTAHSLFAVAGNSEETIRVIKDLDDINVVIEGVIPPGPDGEQLLEQELSILQDQQQLPPNNARQYG